MMTSAQDRGQKRFRPCSGSDTSVDGDLEYLDLDTGRVVQGTSTPNNSNETMTLSKKSYDALMRKLTSMEKCLNKLDKLDKLDQIESSVRNMDKRVKRVEDRIEKTEAVVSGVEKGIMFVSQQYDDVKVDRDSDKKLVKSLEKGVSNMKSETEELKKMLNEMQKLNLELKDEVLDIKSRSMQDNLIFTNIPESHEENTETVLTEFLDNKLHIRNISFERVHRIRIKNPASQRGPNIRPIVAKFTFFKDRERVRKSGKLLKGTNFGIQEQFPYEIEQRRKSLYPALRAARRNRQRATLVKDKLYVDGQEVSVPRVSTAGARLQGAASTQDQSSEIPMETTHL